MLTRRHFSLAGVLVAASTIVLLGSVRTAEAGLFRRFASYPAVRTTSTTAATTAKVGSGCCAPVTKCCPAPCIRYRHIGCPVRCSGCKPAIKTVLCVKNPRTCCPIEIPVCLPSCCQGTPTVRSRPALIGCAVVTYDWCCGVRVVVRFFRCGDVVVTYWNA